MSDAAKAEKSSNDAIPVLDRVHQHLPEYLIEAFALGIFMVSASVVTWFLEAPDSPAVDWIGDPELRRMANGVLMGLTLVMIVYSPWGKQSGAHMNPAMTLTFWSLGKITTMDAAGYVFAQCAGGIAGMALAMVLLPASFGEPPVAFIQTLPGEHGALPALLGEFAITFVLMSCVLALLTRPSIQQYTGLVCAALLAGFISFEAPLSGASLNPARSLASAVPADQYTAYWIYLLAPVSGMLSAAAIHRLLQGKQKHCAKLFHGPRQRCIHCGMSAEIRSNRRTST